MLRSHNTWFIPLALSLVGFVPSAATAFTQASYTFNANYDTLNTSRVISSSVSEAFITGESNDAPYGLNKINGLTYTQIDLSTGIFSFNTDPTTFDLQGIPLGSIMFSGSGSDKLFGTDSATGIIDLNNLTATASGTFTITGGEDVFRGATGTLTFSEVDTLSLDPNAPFTGRAAVNGTIQIVPEPKTDIMPFSMGALILAGVLLRRHSRYRQDKSQSVGNKDYLAVGKEAMCLPGSPLRFQPRLIPIRSDRTALRESRSANSAWWSSQLMSENRAEKARPSCTGLAEQQGFDV